MPSNLSHDKKSQQLIGFKSKADLEQNICTDAPGAILEELGPPAPAAPTATPVSVNKEIATSNTATLEELEPATNSNGNSARNHHTFEHDDLQLSEFMPLIPIKTELNNEEFSDHNFASDDTSDSCGASDLSNRTSPKSWTAADMDNALEALKKQNMSLTRASATYGIPSTTLWQRAHRLGIDTPKKEGSSKSWSEDDLKAALQALRDGVISANKASKAYGIPSSTLYKIARREGIRLAAPFNAAPTSWRRKDLEKALEAIRAGQYSVQRAASHFGIPSGTLYGRCKREGIELSRSNPTPWSENAMGEALEAVRVGQMSINQAAIHFNLPYSSLYGRFKRCKYPVSDTDQNHDAQEFQSDPQENTQTSEQTYTEYPTSTHFFPHLYHAMENYDTSLAVEDNLSSEVYSEPAMYYNQGYYGIASTS